MSLWLKCRLIKNYHCYSKLKSITLDNLFAGTTYKPIQPSGTIEEKEEVVLAEAMADELKDDRLDDGAIEIDWDNKFH